MHRFDESIVLPMVSTLATATIGENADGPLRKFFLPEAPTLHFLLVLQGFEVTVSLRVF